MTEDNAYPILRTILAALDFPDGVASRVAFHGEDRLPSCYPVSDLAVASIGAATAAVSELVGLVSASPQVSVSYRLASLWFGWSIRPQGWDMPNAWDVIAGDYQAQDGWIKLHTNAPHHRAAALSVLGCNPEREAVTSAVAAWQGDELEDAIVSMAGCAARLRSADEWAIHPQGAAVALEPLITWDSISSHKAETWQPLPNRPLAGLRVLDLTRVLAGPVATRFLAGFGADVLRIDPPQWDEPGVIPEVTLGKRCARLDLKTSEGKKLFSELLSKADILVHGYRSDALQRLGLGASERETIRSGLIDISLNAYGHSGPWASRRGFDSLVQFSSGIAAAGMEWRKAAAPVSLPVQALDHATGYLLAAATVRAVIARATGVGPIKARLSLARTAKLLTDSRGIPSTEAIAILRDADFSGTVEHTDWGAAQRLLPPARINGVPMQWSRPASKLGTSAATWALPL